MKNKTFNFRVKSLSYGWCEIDMEINGKHIPYLASYIGSEPMANLIDSCVSFKKGWKEYHIVWQDEPGELNIDMKLRGEKLHLNISDSEKNEKWHEDVIFDDYLSAVISEGFRVLNAFGQFGYRMAWDWDGNNEFPLSQLLYISGAYEEKEIAALSSVGIDFAKEYAFVQNQFDKRKITKKTRLSECSIYYQSWQMQCCGDPFSVGDKIEWTCTVPPRLKNAHGTIYDFEEDHHGDETHSITGTVTKIIAEYSKVEKDCKGLNYDHVCTNMEEQTSAKNFEHEDGEHLWGYIVELKDVTIMPLPNKKPISKRSLIKKK